MLNPKPSSEFLLLQTFFTNSLRKGCICAGIYYLVRILWNKCQWQNPPLTSSILVNLSIGITDVNAEETGNLFIIIQLAVISQEWEKLQVSARAIQQNQPEGWTKTPQSYTSTHFPDDLTIFILTKSPDATSRSFICCILYKSWLKLLW